MNNIGKVTTFLSSPQNLSLRLTSLSIGLTVLLACVFASLAVSAQAVEQKAFVYTELQLSNPFETVPWQAANESIKQQPGNF